MGLRNVDSVAPLATPPEVRQVRYDVALDYMGTHFDRILAEQAGDGFALLRVVPVDGYSSVAVFERHRVNIGDAGADDESR